MTAKKPYGSAFLWSAQRRLSLVFLLLIALWLGVWWAY